MKKKFRIFTAILFTVLIALGIFIYLNTTRQPNNNELPKFNFLTLKQQEFTNKNLPSASNYVILYFSPDCDYCINEITDISNSSIHFKNTFFVLVSPSSPAELQNFNQSIMTSKLNYIILSDSEYHFGKFFGQASIPSTFIYRNKKLISKNQGGVTAKFIYSSF